MMKLDESKAPVILLVDDDNDDIELFCEALLEANPRLICYTASDGEEVFDVLSDESRSRPDLIIMDINMPGMSGIECLSLLKQHEVYKDIPIIMYSTSSQSRESKTAMEIGAACFFTKPNNYKVLLEIAKILIANLKNDLKEMSHQHSAFIC